MTEHAPTDPLREPPERDPSVPVTEEERKRKRKLLWLAIRAVLLLLAVAMLIWGVSSCVQAISSMGSATSAGALLLPMPVPR